MKLSDIARLAGVSVTTASYVINGKAEQRRISSATVERVRAVIEEHGYHPDQQAASLRRGQTRTLGFILPDLENPSYAKLAKLLEQGARARGYQLLIACSDDQPESEQQVLNLFRARRCDALIVASCLSSDDSQLLRLAERVPVIAVDRQLDPQRFCSVVSDDRDACQRLTATLLQPAPRHIALLGARPELIISQERAAGFRSALRNFSGEVLVEHGASFSRECGRQLMEELLQRLGYLPDALITTSYVLLQGVFDVLQNLSGGWPAQLRLATFGDTQLLDFVPLKVNAISQQHALIAERVLQLALDAVEHNAYRPGVTAVPRVLKLRAG